MASEEKSKIVAIDDNLLNLRVLEATLTDYTVFTETDSTKAMSVIEKVKPDLVILDLIMPDINGFELSQTIRSHPDFQQLPILFLSAKTDTADIVRGFQVGGNDYITKPFVREELLARISAQLRLLKADRDRRQMEQQLYLTARLSSMATLAAGISHEINNPLAILLATTEQLASSVASEPPESQPSELQKLLERLRRNGMRIANVVSALQTYVFAPFYHEETFTLRSMVEHTVDLLKGLYESQGIAFDLNLNSQEIQLTGSADNLEFIITSLISNAHDALLANTGEKRIRVTLSREGDVCEITVSDNGCGISTENQQKLFSPFFTTKAPGQGMGLSLAIIHQIVGKMKGSIEIFSEMHNGTTVKVRFPVTL